MLLGTMFIDCFIWKIISTQRKSLPSHSHPVKLLACWRSSAAATTNRSSIALNDDTTRKTVYDGFVTSHIRVPRQIITLRHITAQVLGLTPALILLLKQPHFQCFYRRTTLAGRRIMDTSLRLPFYTTMGSFLDMPQHLPKCMLIAHTEPPSPTIYHC